MLGKALRKVEDCLMGATLVCLMSKVKVFLLGEALGVFERYMLGWLHGSMLDEVLDEVESCLLAMVSGW